VIKARVAAVDEKLMETLQLVFGFVTLATVVWLALDARQRDWTGNRFGNRTWQWVVGALFLWIVVFPMYLVQRRRVPIKA
jgi:uncharacterized membrane protein YdcZ (DUF606 family)